MEQELVIRATNLQRHSEETERNLQFVNGQIRELNDFRENLVFLEESDEKEMLAGLGRGVFIKSEMKEKKLFVEVGAGVILRKTPSEAEKIIEEQIKKFSEARVQLMTQLENYGVQLQEMIRQIETVRKS